MKRIILMMTLLLVSVCSSAQTANVEELSAKVKAMEVQMEELNLQLDKFRTLNNSAGAVFMAGAAMVAWHYTLGDEKGDMDKIGAITAGVGSAALFWTSNAIKRKKKR